MTIPTDNPDFGIAVIGGERIPVIGGLPMVYRPVTTEEECNSLANGMADTGNYPRGLDPCFIAGINGDQVLEDHCIFDERSFCRCEELSGIRPRSKCTSHTEEEHEWEKYA